MKKIYLLLSLLCCFSAATKAQPFVYIYATSPAGGFVTGNSTTTTRTDGNIVAQNVAPSTRGYAVFDLATTGIPAGATIGNVNCGFDKSAYSGGAPTCRIYGYAGDLSMVVTPLTLYNNMVTATTISTNSWGASTGNMVIPSTAAATTFIGGNMGNKVSYCWNITAGTAAYTITGETGAATVSGVHAPWLQIYYCEKPYSLSASASPNPVCDGQTLTLTGGASAGGGVLSYRWQGPTLPLTAPSASPTYNHVVSPASAGIYTITAINTCGALTASSTFTTTAVSVTALPAAIAGATAVCTSVTTTTTLSDATPGGVWSSSAPGTASIDAAGVVTAGMFGTATITYTDGTTGCFVTSPMAVNNPPIAIVPGSPVRVCEGLTVSLSDGVAGGAWSSSAPTTGSVAPTGVVTGIAAGTTTITYDIPGCPVVTRNVTVNATPPAIIGPSSICVGSGTTFSDAIPGGTWSSSAPLVANFTTAPTLDALILGTTTITYTHPTTSCYTTSLITVVAAPLAITGPRTVCDGSTISLSDAASPGVWSSSVPGVGSVTPSGIVTGVSPGVTVISYTMSGVCNALHTVTVHPQPLGIIGTPLVCQNATVSLSDATPGGIWTSSNITQATVGSTTGDVRGVLPSTTAVISYTLPTGCFALRTATVLPSPISLITPAGATSFCTGGSVVLNGTITPGFDYQWNGLGGPITGATNSSYTATTTDSFTLTVTGTNGCFTTSTPMHVVASFLPGISNAGPTSFCFGGSVLLTANAAGALGTVSYQWQKNGVNIPMALSNNYVATSSGIYHATVTITGVSGSCVANTPDDTVNVYAQPAPSITYSGTNFSTGVYPTYQWYLNSVSIPGATSRSYAPHSIGSYRVRVSEGNGCYGYSAEYMLNNVGVAQINKSDVSIFPNPTTGKLHITAPVAVRAVITGMEGKIISDIANAKTIDITAVPAGMYIVMLYDEYGEMITVEKLIKN